MDEIIANFQFIRPWWLLALLPLLLVYIAKLYIGNNDNVWQQIIPQHLYNGLAIKKGMAKSSKFMHFVFLALCLAVFSMSGPTWEKLPQTVYQTQSGKVILLDMSMSMRATDLSPDRLTRAKFKALDLINEINEGETGVVAYAGDAFVVSPLTDDIQNLKTLIPALSPEIMPTQGSYALMGLEKSIELLKNAGYKNGQIYWLTDGIRINEIREIREFIQSQNFEVSALLVGTEDGAPVIMSDGKMLKDRSGKIVIPSIDENLFTQALAGTSARYQLFANDNSDLESIKQRIAFNQQQEAQTAEETGGDVYKDMGPYLCLLLLPIVAYSFRKGVLVLVSFSLLSMYGVSDATKAFAQQNLTETLVADQPQREQEALQSAKRSSLINKIFKNADQRGKLAYDNQDFDQAQNLFADKSWQAASAYKQGNYELAERLYNEVYETNNNTQDLYNKANALAKQTKFNEALEAYNGVLEKMPDHEKALRNKKLIEDILNQQQEQKQENQENQENQEQSQGEDQNSNKDQESSDEQQGQNQEQDGSQQDNQQSQQNQDDQQTQDDQQNSSEQSSSDESEQQNTQQNQDPNDQDLQQQAQQQANENQEQGSSEQNKQTDTNDEQNSKEEMEQKAAISNIENIEDLTPEEQEELQRMQMILNKVPDDPAYLLQRKMLLEAYKRKRTAAPPTQENW